ncbi:hypothetical protein [uncultured Methanobrevibacter sp.]|nr:hypothetical protein [uncultured Methanobrevibacter sp.]
MSKTSSVSVDKTSTCSNELSSTLFTTSSVTLSEALTVETHKNMN